MNEVFLIRAKLALFEGECSLEAMKANNMLEERNGRGQFYGEEAFATLAEDTKKKVKEILYRGDYTPPTTDSEMIKEAQIIAGENIVVENLRHRGLI